MKIHIFTLFPAMFDSFLGHSMMKRAVEKKVVEIKLHDLRDYTSDKHRTCDDKPFGGGPGMLMKPEPVFEAVEALFGKRFKKKGRRFIYLSPQGEPLTQKKAVTLSGEKELVLLCGHYEGVDHRIVELVFTEEISIGDYVLTGGEIPAMVLMDTVIRLLPGVLGRAESKEFESFTGNLLEYPQFTRPAVYRGLEVPKVLLSGNHQAIETWRREKAHERTQKRRPDLLEPVSKKKVGRK